MDRKSRDESIKDLFGTAPLAPRFTALLHQLHEGAAPLVYGASVCVGHITLLPL
jgi:hypothetical protein